MNSDALPFTGERFTPECIREIAYEHWHRYAFARALCASRRVLDAACGEGYGSALLARQAASVLGVDSDPHTVQHARRRYRAPNLRFEVADVARLDHLADGSVDVVVCFETLEHLEAQEAMLAGFARVLVDDGVLLISTPDRQSTTDATGVVNPHHVRELYREEFESLVAGHFPRWRLYGQRLAFQSQIWALEGGHGSTQSITQEGEVFHAGLRGAPTYHLAVCARRGDVFAGLPALSLFADAGQSVYADYRDEVMRNRAAAAHIAHLEAELARLRAPER